MIINLYAEGTLSSTTAAATTGVSSPGGITQNPLIGMLLWVAVFGAIMYFFMIMPQKKREKKAKEMMEALSVNDIVTTIGGLTGRIISIKDDDVTIETGIEKTKVTFKKWAIKDSQSPENR